MLLSRLFTLLYSLSLLALISLPGQAAGSQVGARLQAILDSAPPDEQIPIIVRLSEQIDPALYRHLPKKERRRQLVQGLRANSGQSQKELRKLLQQAGIRKIKDLWHINALAIDADPALIAVIAGQPKVASVSLDGLVALPPAQPAAVAAPDWNLAATGVLELQAQQPGLTGTGVTVATIDTGVDGSHPDLSNWRGAPGGWFDLSGVTVFPVDSNGHGTAVMGVLAGANTGVAPGADWIAANPFAAGIATYSDIHASFTWMLDPDGTGAAPDIVNNSWALENSGSCSLEFAPDITLLKAAEIGVVFAAGNSGPDPSTSQSPANNPGVFSVGATDSSGAVAWFSSRGGSACDGEVFPHLAAPGVGILTTLTGGGYLSDDGTSFSAPHVAGVMALLMQAYPTKTVLDIETAMTDSATDLGPVGPDSSYGYGQLQAYNAWRHLAGEPILSIHDPSAPENDHFLDFGNVTPETSQVRILTLRNAGSSDLQISDIDFSGLPAEISQDSDLCSNAPIFPGTVCQIPLRFSPPDFSAYTGSITIPSDDPVSPTVIVTLYGAGNTPPPVATLLTPADGAVNVARPVSFSWAQAADIDGDTISTSLLIAVTDPDFSQSTPIIVTSVGANSSEFLLAGCGLLGVGAFLRRRHLSLLLVSLSALLVLSCGGGGGSGAVIVGDVVSYENTDLNPGVTYHWKVQSTDSSGAVTESAVRHFTTAP